MMGSTGSPPPSFCCSVFVFEPLRVSGRRLMMEALVSIGSGPWLVMMTYKCLPTIDDGGVARTVEGKFKPATRLAAMVYESFEPQKA
ncbi:hypothetical protein Hanom_Chr04g00331731 [Helianthus anomalus]